MKWKTQISFHELRWGLMAIVVLVLTLGIQAQESRATLSGTVTDATGLAVAGTDITLLNTQTGVSSTGKTNEAGQYRFLFLNPGTYRLTVQVPGFRGFIRENIQMQIGLAAVIDVALRVGELSQSVTVTSEAPLLDADRSDRGLVLRREAVTELPLQGSRNPLTIAVLAPGAVSLQAHLADQPAHSLDGESNWSINGAPPKQMEFVLDGAPNNTVRSAGNNVAFIPPADAVEEVNVMSNAFDAQYGRTAGGVVNMSIRSGANHRHGSLYGFFRRPWLNANRFASNAQGVPRVGDKMDQSGTSFGGPVRIPKLYDGKDRTFFFAAFEALIEDVYSSTASVASVPTLEQRKGDFSKTLDNGGKMFTIYDPLTGAFQGNTWIRRPFPGNQIQPSRFSPIGAKILELYPGPNTTTTGSVPWQNNYLLGGVDAVGDWDFYNFVSRVDHNFSPRKRVFGRVGVNDFIQLRNYNGFPGVAGNHRYGAKANKISLVIDSITMLSSASILNVRASLGHWIGDFKPYVAFDAIGFGFPTSLVAQLPRPDALPRISIDGATAIGQESGNSDYEGTSILSIGPNLALMRGKHTIKTGLDFRVTRSYRIQRGAAAGTYDFTRALTRADYLVQDVLSGVAAASVLLGNPASGSVTLPDPPAYQWLYYAPWVQDDFKITRRLTLNFGFRWDLSMPETERFNRMNYGFFADRLNPISQQIDQTKFPGYRVYGGIGFAGVDGNPRSPVATDWNNLQFRVGAAFRLTERTVLRGGYGTFYMNPTFTGNQYGFSQSTSFVSTLDSGRTPANTIDNPYPDGLIRPVASSLGLRTYLGQSPSYLNTEYKIPYVHQFSFGIQRQLPFNTLMDLSYVGSRSVQQPLSRGVNSLSVENLNLGNPWLGGNPNYLTTRVPNPFQGLLPGTSLNDATIARSQLLRPFPQFGAFNVQQLNTGRLWYNALQVTLAKRYSHGLAFTSTYTLSKNLESEYLNDQDVRTVNTLTGFDAPHRLSVGASYELPFGKGRRYLSSGNSVLRNLLAGWQLMTTATFRSGNPMSIPTGVYLLGDPRLENPTWDRMFKTGVVDTDGTVRNTLPGEQPAFQLRPTNSLRVTPTRYGTLRTEPLPSVDSAVQRNFKIREGATIQVRADASNVFNHPVFISNPNQTPTSVNFGKILRDSGQNNRPRTITVGARLVF